MSTSIRLRQGEHIEVPNRNALPFRYIDRLGRGGSAAVDVVEDKASPHQRFAHKIFRPYYGPSLETFKQEVKNEIDIIKRLQSHPHIVKIHWSYACKNEMGMLLAPVASHGDLGGYLLEIEERGSMTLEERRVLVQSFGCLASGLAFIHSQIIRHKDIKPQNILVHEGHVMYTDFGIALDASNRSTTTTGTPRALTYRYCAPEVADHEARNRKSDVFSLGSVFVEILAVLVPEAAAIALDRTPYWQRIDQVRDSLNRLSAGGSELRNLFAIARKMLDPRSATRMATEVVVASLKDVRLPRSGPGYALFCGECESSNFVIPQRVRREGSSRTPEQSERSEQTHSRNTPQHTTTRIEAPAPPHIQKTTEMTEALVKLMQETLLPMECTSKYISIFWKVRDPNCTHILTSGSSGKVEKPCKDSMRTYDRWGGDGRILVTNAMRVERLVLTELGNSQVKMWCETCQKLHMRCFQAAPEHVARVIEKYARWMDQEPYHKDGKFRKGSRATEELRRLARD
ncbi:kinase-like protein [Periconia macrospinosa]|uniref:non-specific serine/threonine protein kinase n=1 Tax=Periconia macrospinosa TaxID=97972 RepID=A0A2V1DBV7_9PLEO|nr:kinase-like protein [Periconia macrospinosa]